MESTVGFHDFGSVTSRRHRCFMGFGVFLKRDVGLRRAAADNLLTMICITIDYFHRR